jgi:hypothetical protein
MFPLPHLRYDITLNQHNDITLNQHTGITLLQHNDIILIQHRYVGVGHKRILMLAEPTPLSAVRVQVHSHFAMPGQTPTLRDITLYDWTGSTIERCV